MLEIINVSNQSREGMFAPFSPLKPCRYCRTVKSQYSILITVDHVFVFQWNLEGRKLLLSNIEHGLNEIEN